MFILASAGEILDGFVQIFQNYGLKPAELLAQILNFCIVAFLLYRLAFKPVLQTVELRQKKISDGLQYAEEMKAKLAETEKEHVATMQKAQKEAQDIIAEARDKAKVFLEKQTQEASLKSEEMIKKAQEAIALERKKMLVEVREEVTQLVIATTSKVLSKELSEQDKSQFSKAAAQELSSVGS